MGDGGPIQGAAAAGPIAGVSAAILAGGASRRMGQDKALLPWGTEPGGTEQGGTVIGHLASVLRPLFDEVLLVAHDPSPYEFLGLPAVRDREAGLGPLGGIEAALRASSNPRVFVVACDMPFLEPALIRFMAALADAPARVPAALAVVPFLGDGRPEPLHALYDRRLLPLVERLLAAGERRVQALLVAADVRRVGAEEVRRFADLERVFANLNRPEDYERAQRHSREV